MTSLIFDQCFLSFVGVYFFLFLFLFYFYRHTDCSDCKQMNFNFTTVGRQSLHQETDFSFKTVNMNHLLLYMMDVDIFQLILIFQLPILRVM